MLQLEVGKKYISRNGMFVHILREFAGLYYDQFDNIFKGNGEFGKSCSQYNLISEHSFTKAEMGENNKKYNI